MSDNRVSVDIKLYIFINEIWDSLEVESDQVIRESLPLIKESLQKYNSGESSFPDIDFIIGMAKDNIKSKKNTVLSDEDKKQKIRDSWIQKFN